MRFLISLIILTISINLLAQDVKVKGYYRKDGTYVQPHNRSRPNKTKMDNWSTYGNVNPYTGERGTKKLYETNVYQSSTNNYGYTSSFNYTPGYFTISITYDIKNNLYGLQLNRYLWKKNSGFGYLIGCAYTTLDKGDHFLSEFGLTYNIGRKNKGISLLTGASRHIISNFDTWETTKETSVFFGAICKIKAVSFRAYYDLKRASTVYGIGFSF